MAIHAHSTTAPALQPRLLRPFTFRPTPPVVDPRSADELLEEIRLTIKGQEGIVPANGTLAAEESTARQPCDISNLLQKEALASTAAQGLLSTADQARAIHMRRELHRALDHGFALLDALDLPPLALDVIDDAIATLDAMEAPDEDLEPWLAGVVDLAFVDGAPAIDAEGDSEEDEGTALESFGRGFVRAGEDDAEESDEPEDSDPAERDDEHGTEDDPFPWRYDPALVAFAARVSHV